MNKAKKKITALALSLAAVSAMAVPAFAGDADVTLESGMSSISTSLLDSIKSVVNSMVGFMGSALPVILIVVGASLLIAFGTKFFKKFTK